MPQKIFITGASGCIGQYVLDRFVNRPEFELYLLARFPEKIRKAANIHIVQGELAFIEKHADVIADMDYMIHIATDWSDGDYARYLNVEKTHVMFGFTDPKKCKKIVYFSTASILGKNNAPIVEAEKYGTGYVKSKYQAYMALHDERVVTLFPTLVFGGDATHPYSHISSGIKPNVNYLKWLRFFTTKFSFHFMHAKDIAAITEYALLHNTKKDLVLGHAQVSGGQVLRQLCKTFKIPVYFRIPIAPWFVLLLAKIFRIKIGPWDYFCITQGHMTYDTVAPETFGMTSSFPNLKVLLEDLQLNSPISR